jgi:NAD(P)-dependent dehydrogenase (short-subunit alcohol dehydrogenase family)
MMGKHDIFDFKERRIIVSGAANGIGCEISALLALHNAELILIDKDSDALQTLSDKLYNQQLHSAYNFDVSNLDQIDYFISNIIKESGPIDGYVNCIGIRSRRPLNSLTPDIVNQVISINFTSFIEFIRVLSRKGNFNPGFSIVGISSISSLRGNSTVTAYAASKGAMDSAVRCLAKELSRKKIRVNTVLPGQIDTPEYKRLKSLALNEEDTILSRQYLGLGQPSDVANAVLFLLSEASSFITGSSIPVDGGFLSN